MANIFEEELCDFTVKEYQDWTISNKPHEIDFSRGPNITEYQPRPGEESKFNTTINDMFTDVGTTGRVVFECNGKKCKTRYLNRITGNITSCKQNFNPVEDLAEIDQIHFLRFTESGHDLTTDKLYPRKINRYLISDPSKYKDKDLIMLIHRRMIQYCWRIDNRLPTTTQMEDNCGVLHFSDEEKVIKCMVIL